MSTYINDSESVGEFVRLNDQAVLVNKATGLLPDRLQETTFTTVLDVGCGPGRWALDFAFQYPDAEVAGIDLSTFMIDYANAQARSQNILNATFGIQNFLEDDAAFAENAFNLIHLRFAMSWIKGVSRWQQVLQRCSRLLAPGGHVVITEGEGISTNSLAVQRMQDILCEAFFKAGYSLSASPRFFGVVGHLGALLSACGFQHIQTEANVLDSSYYNQDENGTWLRSFQSLLVEASPFLLTFGGTTVEELATLDRQISIDMYQESFCGIGPLFTFCAQKPENVEKASMGSSNESGRS